MQAGKAGRGHWTKQLSKEQLEKLGLLETHEQLTELMEGREIRYVIYESLDHLTSRGSAIILR